VLASQLRVENTDITVGDELTKQKDSMTSYQRTELEQYLIQYTTSYFRTLKECGNLWLYILNAADEDSSSPTGMCFYANVRRFDEFVDWLDYKHIKATIGETLIAWEMLRVLMKNDDDICDWCILVEIPLTRPIHRSVTKHVNKHP